MDNVETLTSSGSLFAKGLSLLSVDVLCVCVRRCAGAQQGAAASDYCDAVLAEMLWRFWCFERIGPAERARLRAALARVHRAELDEASLTPSMRRVLLDERDDGAEVQDALLGLTKQRTVPSVFINGQHLGGNDDTQKAAASGKLKEMLGA